MVIKKLARRLAHQLGYEIVKTGVIMKDAQSIDPEKIVPFRSPFNELPYAGLAMQVLIENYAFETVLDIGCGQGLHADCFLQHTKQVTSIDYGKSIYFEKNTTTHATILCDFNTYQFADTYDCVWASHVLEHQLNPHIFLKKIFALLKEGGVLAITVPPLKHNIVGGHVSLWNGGLLLYHLVLAGFDCVNASVFRYGYNISVIVKKCSIELPELAYDAGDIQRLAAFLPNGFTENAYGNFRSLNFPPGSYYS